MSRNKLLAVLVALVMIVGMLPVSTLAESEIPASGTDIVTENETPAPGADTVTENETPAPGTDTVTENETPAPGADIVTENETPASGTDTVTENETPAPGTDIISENENPAAVTNADTEKKDPVKESVDSDREDSSKKDSAAEKTKTVRAKAKAGKAAPPLRAEGNPGAGTWSELKVALENAENGSTITLEKNLKAADQDTTLIIQSNKTITIDLNGHRIDRNRGAALEAVSGGGVFEVKGQLTIIDSIGNGLITGGYSDSGGGICVLPGGSCTIESGIIRGNRATNGGGIYSAGTLTITGGTIEENRADSDGGGIYSLGTATIASCRVMLNKAGNGAGIYAGSGTAEVSGGAQLTGNTASSNGGGIYLNAGTLNLFNCNIGLNRAGGEGGGIRHCDSGTLNVKGAPVVVSNTALTGSNILLGEADGSVITVVDKLTDAARLDVTTKKTADYAITSGLEGQSNPPKGVIGNFSYSGSGTSQLAIREDGELYHERTPADIEVSSWKDLQGALNTMEYRTIALSGNVVAEDGDVTLQVRRSVTIDLNGKTINRNLTSCDDKKGGVLDLNNGDEDSIEVTIKDSLGSGAITGGNTNQGGGINIHPGVMLCFEGGTIERNAASNCGGGIYNGGKLVMKGGQIAFNEAQVSGGGIYSNGDLEATGTAIRNNKAGVDGGGIYSKNAQSDSRMQLSGLTLFKNTAGHGGGGIYIRGIPGGPITDSMIDNNAADCYGGGVAFSGPDQTLAINNTVISSNTAKGNASDIDNPGGGGIYLIDGRVDMTGGALINNTSGQGGAVTLPRGTRFEAEHVRIQGNKATDGCGGAIMNNKATLGLSRCEITGNEAADSGGAVYDSGLLTVLESAFTGNRAEQRGGAIYAASAEPFVTNTTITGNSAGLEGGGVYIKGGMAVQGKVIVRDNSGSDVFLFGISGDMRNIRAAGSLAGSWIGVSGRPEEGLVTRNFRENNPDADPADFFFAKSGYSIVQGKDGDAEIVKSEWPQLQKKIRDAKDGGTIKLDRNWKADQTDSQLIISGGKTLTIDLNGFTIDRNRDSADKDGHVLEVMDGAALIVTDTSAGKTGRITGGWAEKGGGISVQKNAACTIEAGSITGNRAVCGAGIYSAGTINVTGGRITSNEASSEAGGIAFESGSTLGVGGMPFVTENTAPAGKNILVREGAVVTVVSALDAAARLDVTTKNADGPITSGLAGKGLIENFTYNENGCGSLEIREDGELYFRKDAADLWVSDWQTLQNAINDDANQGKTIGLVNDITASQNDNCLILKDRNLTIALNGHTLDRNLGESDPDGHVFELSGSASLTIRDSSGAGRITGGFAGCGGAILIGSGAVCTIEGGAVTGNRASLEGGGVYVQGTLCMTGGSVFGNTGEDGGGIFVCEGGSIDLTDTELSNNASTGRGGAVCSKGTAVLKNCTVRNNRADSEGGAIYNGSSKLTLSKCSITGNEATEGGGIFSFGEVSLNETAITGNLAGEDGGGAFMRGSLNMNGGCITNNTGSNGGGLLMYAGNATLTGIAVKNNRAAGQGGGICVNEGAGLSLVGGSITENSAAEGGGIRVSGTDSALSMEGAVVVKDNMDSDVFLGAGSRIRITGAFSDGAKVGVYQKDAPGTPFTDGYGVHEPSADPADYFFANEGYEVHKVHKENTEAVLSVWHKEMDGTPFVEQNSQVAREYTHLNSRYWMSGISGERRLNEINIPGTHDSGMADVEGNVNTDVLSTYSGLAETVIGQLIDMGLPPGLLVSLAGAKYGGIDTPIEVSKYLAAYARSQRAFLDEQLAMGVRALDIRLNTYCAKLGYPVKKYDDGASLYLIHRIEPNIGEYFARDRGGEFLTFQKVLDLGKAFLKENPTETIILNVQIDGTGDLYEEGANRIKEHLKTLSNEINPSTGESYLYMENDVFGERYTAYPKLKDCRGKIVLSASDADASKIGGLVSGIGLQEIEKSNEGPFDNAEAKIRDLADFYDHYGGSDLPENLERHIDYGYFVGTNGVDSRILPLDASDEVLGALFGEDGILKNREGKYLGLVNMDGANAKNCRQVWSTNFFDRTEYCTVTAKSGLGESDTKTYTVIKGTPITIPECIYAAPPSASGIYFEGWHMTGDKVQSDGGDFQPGDKDQSHGADFQPGESFTVLKDVTFTAQWSSGTRTPITVIWKDGDDKDGLQPDSLKIKVNDTQEMTVTKYDNWKHVYTGEVETVEPVMEGEWGAKYSGSVISTPAGGFVVTLTHTPGDKIDVKGTIYWRDDENKGNTRPDAVTLHLYANKKDWGSQEVFASDDWKFDFGQQPEYLDGAAVVYRITEDAIDGYTPLITGFVIRNVSHKASRKPTGFVFWADDDNAANTRPGSVTVNLLKNGEKIDSTTVTENASGEWPFHFDMGKDDSAYTITQEDVAGYDTVIQKDGVEQGVTYVINKSKDHVHTPTELSTEITPATCETSGERKVVKYCAACTEILSEKTEEIPALGHDWKAWSTLQEASGTETGLQRRICKRDASHEQTRIIPKTGHVHGLVHIAAKVGCTEDGNIEYWKCAEGDDPCGLCFEDAAGTKWIDEEDTVTPPHGHNWGEWIVNNPATETAEGSETRTCANCGKIETRSIPAVVAYHFTEGDGSAWTKGSDKGLTFTFTRSIGDSSTFRHFSGIQIDGKTVPEKDASGKANWTAKSGSVIIELQSSYLETLSVGNHKLTVQFDDSADVTASFTVKAGAENNLLRWIMWLFASLYVIIRII